MDFRDAGPNIALQPQCLGSSNVFPIEENACWEVAPRVGAKEVVQALAQERGPLLCSHLLQGQGIQEDGEPVSLPLGPGTGGVPWGILLQRVPRGHPQALAVVRCTLPAVGCCDLGDGRPQWEAQGVDCDVHVTLHTDGFFVELCGPHSAHDQQAEANHGVGCPQRGCWQGIKGKDAELDTRVWWIYGCD